MGFDRKFYMVAMVIFALLLCTTNIYAANLDLFVSGDGGGTILGCIDDDNDPDTPPPATSCSSTELKSVTKGDTVEFTLITASYFQAVSLFRDGGADKFDQEYLDKDSGDYLDVGCAAVAIPGQTEVIKVTCRVTDWNDNFNVIATFEEIPTNTHQANAEGNGTIAPSGEVIVKQGESITFDITPDTYYQIADVLVDGVSQGRLSSVTFPSSDTENHNITASFEPIPVVAAFGPGPDNADITEGDQVQFSADASQGNLTYWEWSINGVLISEDEVPPLLLFEDAGPYTVELKVGNDAIFDIASEVYTVKSSYLSNTVMQQGTSKGYESLQSAYTDIAGMDETIRMKAGTLPRENIFLDKIDVSVVIEGGYDDIFANVVGFTIINGYVIISQGTATLANVIISSL